jgi:hypothetical protein
MKTASFWRALATTHRIFLQIVAIRRFLVASTGAPSDRGNQMTHFSEIGLRVDI